MGAAGGNASDVRFTALIKWLCFAATPTFAIMAVLTSIIGGGPIAILSPAAPGSPLSGMVLMYLLMSAFHSPPWLKLIAKHRPMYSSR